MTTAYTEEQIRSLASAPGPAIAALMSGSTVTPEFLSLLEDRVSSDTFWLAVCDFLCDLTTGRAFSTSSSRLAMVTYMEESLEWDAPSWEFRGVVEHMAVHDWLGAPFVSRLYNTLGKPADSIHFGIVASLLCMRSIPRSCLDEVSQALDVALPSSALSPSKEDIYLASDRLCLHEGFLPHSLFETGSRLKGFESARNMGMNLLSVAVRPRLSARYEARRWLALSSPAIVLRDAALALWIRNTPKGSISSLIDFVASDDELRNFSSLEEIFRSNPGDVLSGISVRQLLPFVEHSVGPVRLGALQALARLSAFDLGPLPAAVEGEYSA